MVITTWEWTRVSGLTSFFLIFISVFAGLLHSAPISPRKWKVSLFFFHQFTGWLGFLIIIFHGAMLLFDSYVSYQWYEVLVPFMSDEHRLLNGIGTIAFYGIFLILLSSDMMKKVGRSLWKKIHLFSLPAYLLALVHGVLVGTDSDTGTMMTIYAGTSFLLLAALMMKRVSVAFQKKERSMAKEG
ncbi:ferric reductase-like transmembrane domain-containing protein [Paenisporosarcina antarctica]|uniref:Ferric reductase n=1 Tax=Paenisporosarcina antarctica TaxID=417367 RepID=A0A4P6ZUU1_9BACL|nr:ferric reductase-like transmembrane domain-containing protein [Paenisporosarcina antarctica]QBP40240.1 ferric reductase [Paenisporosarcina antarctica]